METADPKLIAQLVDKIFSIQWCRDNLIVPINLEEKSQGGGTLIVAIADYTNLATIGEFVKMRAKSIGCTASFVELKPSQIQATIEKVSVIILRGYIDDHRTSAAASGTEIVDSLRVANEPCEGEIQFEFEDSEDLEIHNQIPDISIELLGSPIQKAAAQILITSGRLSASDIHIEPHSDKYKIRVRRDGVMQDYVSMPRSAGIKLTACLKNMASMDIAERRRSQSGRIKRIFEGMCLECACSTASGIHGEKMVIRLLATSNQHVNLDLLIANEDIRSSFRKAITMSSGVILVTGPTGSGKSTTVAIALREIDNGELNILTVEDPVEYELGGNIQQFQVGRSMGVTSSSLVKQFLWQDPDVILVGEAREPEIYEVIFDAAETGHLVFTTLHAGSCAQAIRLLQLLNLPQHRLFTLSGCILAQRLVRKVCPQCSTQQMPSAESAKWIGISAETPIRVATCLPAAEKHARTEDGSLCPRCEGTGYQGRCAIYELIELTPSLMDILSRTSSLEDIQAGLTESGMLTLMDYSRDLVQGHQTTIEEVFRVLGN